MTWSTFQSLKIFDLQSPLRNYIDQLEQPGGKQYNIQNFMMMYIFGSTTNTEYRTKLFDHWPTVAFLKKSFAFLWAPIGAQPRHLDVLTKFCSVPGGLQWVQGNHGIPLSWDAGGGVPVARGDRQEHQDLGPRLRTRQRGFYCKNIFLGREFTGIFSQLRNEHGFTNIDGLDPSSGLLAAAQEKGETPPKSNFSNGSSSSWVWMAMLIWCQNVNATKYKLSTNSQLFAEHPYVPT